MGVPRGYSWGTWQYLDAISPTVGSGDLLVAGTAIDDIASRTSLTAALVGTASLPTASAPQRL